MGQERVVCVCVQRVAGYERGTVKILSKYQMVEPI